ncbi:phage tail tape measure protein [Neotabrizicola sp. VNH66]|uniref:phage tail tape measure protein n=1 Tax=Neotabrizicola sp. VNH66 TaxID=3400918 RepID=UPI003C30C1F5
MTTVDLPGLVVPIEARIDRLERSLKKANQAQGKAARDMERRAKQSADRMAKSYESAGGRISGAFKSIVLPKFAGIAGTVAGIGVAGGAAAVRQTVAGIAEIGNAAKRAGIQAEAFQEWSYVADQNRISIDALTDGFKEMNLRAGEFLLDGTGAGAEAFKKLGYSADELKEKLQDPSALMVEILGRLGKFDQAGQSFLLEELFGGAGGEQFSALIGKGEAGLRAQIARARDLGLVLDDGAVRKAGERIQVPRSRGASAIGLAHGCCRCCRVLRADRTRTRKADL